MIDWTAAAGGRPAAAKLEDVWLLDKRESSLVGSNPVLPSPCTERVLCNFISWYHAELCFTFD